MQKRLWVATGLALILSGAIWWSLEDEKKKAAKPEAKEDAPRILDIPAADVTKLEFKRPAENSTIALEKTPTGWNITAPQPYRADNEAVEAIIKAFGPLDSAKLVEEKPADYAPFGFNAPRLLLTLTKKDGKTHTLEVGDENPASSEYYARLTGAPRLYTLSGSTFTPLDKRLPDLRDKRILTFDSTKVKTIELQAKGATIEFAPTPQKDWQIVKPSLMRADGLSVEEILRKLSDARMDLNTTHEEKSFAAGTPVATVKVTDANGVQTFELRKNNDDYYAKSSAVEGVHKLTKDVAETLDKDLPAFRSKKLFDFGFSELSKIEFRDGTKTAVYERKGADWQKTGKKVENVPALVDKLRDLSVLRFLDAGMAAPSIEASITSTNRKESLKIAKSGNMWVAQRDGSTELYEIDGKLIEDLQKAAGDIK